MQHHQWGPSARGWCVNEIYVEVGAGDAQQSVAQAVRLFRKEAMGRRNGALAASK